MLPGKIDAIRRFWDGFAVHADMLDEIFGSGRGEIDHVSEVMAELRNVSPDLMWEFGPSERGHMLTITSEWRHGLRALARAVVNMAPKLERFAVVDARDGNEGGLLDGNFEARFGLPISVSEISTAPGRDNKVAMTGKGPGDEDRIGNEVLALGTFLLGEAVDRNWFGDVASETQSSGLLSIFGRKKAAGAFDPEAFRAKFEATIATIAKSLPETRRADADFESEERLVMQLNGAHVETGRPDLFLFNTVSEPYFTAALTTTRFASVNHSRLGEWFLFVRIPRTSETPYDDVGDRYALEEALHTALSAAGLGGVMAAGHGQEAVYIDIAAETPDAALPLIARTLEATPGFSGFTVHFLEAGLAQTGLPLENFVAPRN